jgi:hypothetical protein
VKKKALTTDGPSEPAGWLLRILSPNGTLTPQQEHEENRAARKLLIDSAKFRQRANPLQQEQLNRLTRWYRMATYGPALSVSRRRRRALVVVHTWHECRRSDAASRALDEVLTPIMDALDEHDHEFFGDMAIAIKFLKRSAVKAVEAYLAGYSLMSVGKEPRYTCAELHRMLSQFSRMSPQSFRNQIRKLRREHGDFAVPLKPGKPGRPKKRKK